MNIRVANENDLPKIMDLYAALEADTEERMDLDRTCVIYSTMKTYPDYNVYVAEIDGEIVGAFELAIMDNLAHSGDRSGLIEDVVVSEAHRGKGIGKYMMQHAIAVCKAKKCYKVALSSNKKRVDAHRFYESLGYQIHGYSFSMELK